MTYIKENNLVSRLKAGDEAAFEELYRMYYNKIYFFTLRMLKNNMTEAEGVTQEVFIRVWENRSVLDSQLSISGYLFKLAKNQVLNFWRKELNKKKYHLEIQHLQIEASDETTQQIVTDDLTKRIDALIRKLPDKRQKIFLLSRDTGLSYKEIAKQLKITENTVDTQIRLALKFLRKEISKMLITILFFFLLYPNF